MKQLWKILGFGFLTCCLAAGCVKYRPQPILPSQTAAEFEKRTLDNPRLQQFLEQHLQRKITTWPPPEWDFEWLNLAALYYSPALELARAQWGVTNAEIITAGTRPNPSVGFTPEYDAHSPPETAPWTVGLTFDIPIETAGKRGYRIKQAELNSRVARWHVQDVQWEVRQRLREAVLNLYAAQQRESLLKKKEELQQRIVKSLEQSQAAGEVSALVVTTERISFDQTRLAVYDVQKTLAEQKAELATALGVPLAAADQVRISFSFLETFPPQISGAELRHQALLNRPDILAALTEYAAREAALELEIAKQYPDIHLGPGYTYDQGENKWAMGFTVALPIFDRNQGPIAKAEALREEAKARFNALQTQIIGELDQALSGYQLAVASQRLAEELVVAQQKELQSVEAMLKTGEVDRSAVLNAELALTAAEQSRLETRIKLQQSLGSVENAAKISLNKAPGL